MVCMKKCFFFIVLSMVISLSSSPLYSEENQGPVTRSGKDMPSVSETGELATYSPMMGPGKKVSIGNGSYLIYGFDKKPKLGTVIMKVEIFDQEGRKDTSLGAKADAGMPSMRGAHETGDRPFVLSKKGDYLLPVNIVMPGDWEIRLTIIKGGKIVSRGRYNFDV